VFADFRWTRVSALRNIAMAEFEPVQPFLLAALAEHAGCKTFIDVGANVGAYAICATRIPSVERIIAFEPNQPAARELHRNARLNGAEIELHGTVASDTEGEVCFGVVSRYAGTNAVVDSATWGQKFVRKELVRSVRLDGLADLSPPLCLKIDVEGHESKVLAGASALLVHPCVLQVESYGGREALPSLPGYRVLTHVGPDFYLTNIDELDAISAYENALSELIDYNHRHKMLTLRAGDFALQITGRSGNIARQLGRRIVGSKL
jgi:FkbM family methyltransferase